MFYVFELNKSYVPYEKTNHNITCSSSYLNLQHYNYFCYIMHIGCYYMYYESYLILNVYILSNAIL